MRFCLSKLVSTVCVFGSFLCVLDAKAESGVTDDTVAIGMSAPFTGSSAQFGLALREGAEAYLRFVNESGGIHGRKILLIASDDGEQSLRTVANTRKMISDGSVLTLMSYYGATTTEAILPILSSSGIPLIGVASGAESLRDPPQRFLFNLRASYHDETDAIIIQLDSQGLGKVAILYQNDSTGRAVLKSAKKTMLNLAITPTAISSVEPGSFDVSKAVSDIAASKPQAVILIVPASTATEFMRQMQRIGAYPQFLALSLLTDDPLIRDKGRGLGVSQVIPYPRNMTLPVAKQYLTLLRQYPNAIPSYYSFEGFLTAKLTVDAIRRAGKNPTREKLILALEGEYDLDGYVVRFAPNGLYSRSGSRFVEMSVIGRDGRTVR